jgi:hypothetical protein
MTASLRDIPPAGSGLMAGWQRRLVQTGVMLVSMQELAV